MAGGPGPFSGQAGAPIDMDIGCIGELSPRLPPRAFSWIWPLPFSPTPAIAPPRYVFRDGRHPSVDAPSTLVCAQELAARFLVTKGTPAGSTQAAPKLGARAKRAPLPPSITQGLAAQAIIKNARPRPCCATYGSCRRLYGPEQERARRRGAAETRMIFGR
jgi:hypothetical protein